MQFTKSLTVLMAFIAIVILNQQSITPELVGADKLQNITSKKYPDTNKPKKRYDQPGKAAAWMASMRKTPKGTNPAQLNIMNHAIIKASKAQKSSQDLTALSFEEIGPGLFGGRIRGFVMHPEREGHLLAGGVSGGVWKSTDDGQTWQQKTDFLDNIAIGSMLLDPDNPEKVYVGTGEGFFNFAAAQGYGIFVSEDFGETWERYGFTNQVNFYYVNRMAKIPNSNAFFAATSRGIFKSTDEGQVWNEMTGVDADENDRGFTDLKVDPSDPDHLLAYFYGEANSLNHEIVVSTPTSLSGTYDSVPASFGPSIPSGGITGEMLLVSDGVNPARDGCEEITNDIVDKIALIERGSCSFTTKVTNAQTAGAIAVIVFQNTGDDPFSMGFEAGDEVGINIPSVMVSKALGDRLRTGIPPVNLTIRGTQNISLDRFIMRSTNGGDFWATLDNHGLPDLDVDRMEIGFGSDGKTYIAVSKPTVEFENGSTNGTLGLYRSVGSNNTFFEKTASNANFIERQGWYDLAVAVNPEDSDHVLIGAVDQSATINGGDTISKTSEWSSSALQGRMETYIHADHHGYFFSPFNNDHIYVVSDGGVGKSEDGGQTWDRRNTGLNISQSYGIAVSPDGERITSGTQDNGSQLYLGDQERWYEWWGGDGGYSAWDQQDGNFVYGSRPRGSMFGSNNSGFTDVGIPLPDTTGAAFIQPFAIDPNNGNHMLVGTDNLFFSANIRSLNTASFTDVSGAIGQVSATTISSVDGTQAFGGTTAGTLIRVDNLGTTNDVTDISAGLQVGSDITDIYVDPTDGMGTTLIVTQADYGPNRLSRSNNGGSSWTSVSGNLPNIPLLAVTSDPLNPGRFFVGSELGLFVTEDITVASPEWARYDFGPAFTRIIDLVWNNDNLYIGTHGRGTYKASRDLVAIELNDVQVTDMACDNDDVLDVDETANVLLDFTNLGGMDITGAMATVSATGVTITNPMVNLGTINTSVTQAFEITLNSSNACPGTLMLDVTVTHDNGSTAVTVEIPVQSNLVINTTGFQDTAESTEYMTSDLVLGGSGWSRVDTQALNGTFSWFSADENAYSDKSLVSPWLTSNGNNSLTFSMFYNMEGNATQYWDGVLLELRTRDEDWIDIGILSTVPYDGLLFTNNTAPARLAWSGNQSSWRTASVDLGTTYNGEDIQFRFRMVTDVNSAAQGFWVDDIQMTNVEWISDIQCGVCSSDLIFADGFE